MSSPRHVSAPAVSYKKSIKPKDDKLNSGQRYALEALQHDRCKNDFSFTSIAFTALIGAGLLFFASQNDTVKSFLDPSSSPGPSPK